MLACLLAFVDVEKFLLTMSLGADSTETCVDLGGVTNKPWLSANCVFVFYADHTDGASKSKCISKQATQKNK